jgi:type IV secretory pathway VirB6-like protein
MNVILEEKKINKKERGNKVFISKLNTRLKNNIQLFVPAYLHVLHFLVIIIIIIIIIIIFILFTMTTIIYATASLATRGVV